jgi:hypothetical protein
MWNQLGVPTLILRALPKITFLTSHLENFISEYSPISPSCSG